MRLDRTITRKLLIIKQLIEILVLRLPNCIDALIEFNSRHLPKNSHGFSSAFLKSIKVIHL